MELAALGTVVHSAPSEQELQSGEGGQSLRVSMTSAREGDALRAAAAAISEVMSVAVQPIAAAPATRRHEQPAEPQQAAAPQESEADRRRIDLGPAMRGASAEEQLAAAGARMARLCAWLKWISPSSTRCSTWWASW